jgi:hypothetical protein
VNVRKSILSIVVFGLGASVGNAQQLTIGTGTNTGTPATGTNLTTGVPLSGTGLTTGLSTNGSPGPVGSLLTPELTPTLKQRLEGYRAYHQKAAPRASALRDAGLSAEVDAVERTKTTAGGLGPVHVGRLRPVESAAAGDVDPGLAYATRQALAARLGREPTRSELNTELRAFDARIAQVNQSLADKRQKIAEAVKRDGIFPRAVDAAVLGVAPADPQANSPEARNGMRALLQILLTQ